MNNIILYIGIGLLLVWDIVLTVLLIKSRKKTSELFKGVDGKNLEEVLSQHIARVEKAVQQNIEIEQDFEDFKKFSKKFLYKIGFKRFNPFQNTGGDQSFAIAILDDNNDGFIISSMHAREGTRVFAKPITNGEAKKYKLSKEESDVLTQALN